MTCLCRFRASDEKSTRKTLIFLSRYFHNLVSVDPILPHPSIHGDLSGIRSKEDLLKSYTVTPPIKSWPQKLFPKRLISMIRLQQNLDLALQIFNHAGKYHPGFSHNYDTYDTMIEKLARARAFDSVEVLLTELKSSKLQCGENLFITVIRNYGLANKPKMALKTFVRIRDFGVQTSVRALNTLLNAMIQCQQFDYVHLLFKNSKTKFGIIPNVFTGNILIKALCKKNDLETALEVLDEMPSLGMIPNIVTFSTIMGCYCGRGDLKRAKKVFDEIISRGWIPDAVTYTILIEGFCRLGNLIDAVKLMDEMEENGVEPNEATFGVVIEAYCKSRKSGEALNLLDDMIEKKFIPSSALTCKVIDLLCHEGKVEEGCAIWKKLLKKNCTPDNVISSALIYWLCKKGKIWEAKKLFDEFERGTIPSVLTYNTLISGMCENNELREAAKLWDEMVEKRCKPNAFTYNMMIKGFCKSGNAKEGIKIFEEMLAKGCVPNKLTYSLLIDGLCSVDSKEDFIRALLLAVSSEGIFLDLDSWVLLVEKVSQGSETWRHTFDMLLENA